MSNKGKISSFYLLMIAIGGSIGAGLFLMPVIAFFITGLSILVALLVGGVVVNIITRSLSDMTVDFPSRGSFIEHASLYLGEGAGFITGWNSWLLFAISCSLSIIVATKILYLWTGIPEFILPLIILLIFLWLNHASLEFFCRVATFLNVAKIVIMLASLFIAIGLIYQKHNTLFNGINSINDFFHYRQFFSNGALGFFIALSTIIIAFVGVEFVSIAAYETRASSKVVPRIMSLVVWCTVGFYLFTTAIILVFSCYNGCYVASNLLPSLDFLLNNDNYLGFLNLIFLLATLSSLNSCLYAATRILAYLASRGKASRIFSLSNKRGISTVALYFTSFIIIVLLSLYLFTGSEIIILYMLVSIATATVFNWYIILIAHIFFKKENLNYQGGVFKQVLPNLFAMLILFLVVVYIAKYQIISWSIYIVPAWLIVLLLIYALRSNQNNRYSR